ncbi:uncharacterized protein LOC122501052 [Leptopilina heterotoma]|uniref:uncharacterized protein LOC122501052 n=1 Tax=Leptopilina heterotoma TaxID=63436 RepID=UPI001CA8ACBF|nr:uncharacterized protein LOC122501052 [Leptopilina heterotoma]
MIELIFFTLVSMVAASPITITEFQGRYYLPFFNNYQNIERSDSYAAATETEGYNDDVTGTDPHYFSGENSGGQIETSGGGGYEGQHDYSSYADYGNYHGSNGNPHGLEDHGNNYVHSVPVSEHVEVTKPIAIPVYKDIGIPVPQPVKINVPHPVAIGVNQPYPVAVPVARPVPIQIIKTIAVPVEKKVPYPVEKHIPVPVEKPVPITIERHIPVPLVKPYPIKIPIYKTIYHHAKGHSHNKDISVPRGIDTKELLNLRLRQYKVHLHTLDPKRQLPKSPLGKPRFPSESPNSSPSLSPTSLDHMVIIWSLNRLKLRLIIGSFVSETTLANYRADSQLYKWQTVITRKDQRLNKAKSFLSSANSRVDNMGILKNSIIPTTPTLFRALRNSNIKGHFIKKENDLKRGETSYQKHTTRPYNPTVLTLGPSGDIKSQVKASDLKHEPNGLTYNPTIITLGPKGNIKSQIKASELKSELNGLNKGYDSAMKVMESSDSMKNYIPVSTFRGSSGHDSSISHDTINTFSPSYYSGTNKYGSPLFSATGTNGYKSSNSETDVNNHGSSISSVGKYNSYGNLIPSGSSASSYGSLNPSKPITNSYNSLLISSKNGANSYSSPISSGSDTGKYGSSSYSHTSSYGSPDSSEKTLGGSNTYSSSSSSSLSSSLSDPSYSGANSYGIPLAPTGAPSNTVTAPIYKNVVQQPVEVEMEHPIVFGESQHYPIHVPVSHPVPVPVIRTIAVPVEKKVPFPVEKIVPYAVEKHIPYTIEKNIPVPVERPYPIHVPVYRHIYHRYKGHGHRMG